jgi:YD repeat-containing protein
VRRAYDEYGNLVETGYYDRHEQLVAVLGKVARITASYSEDGLLKARASYGVGGRLVADPYGVARYEFTYDEQGNRTGETFFDPEGNAVRCRMGYARAAFSFEEDGRLVKSRFYDEKGKQLATQVVVQEATSSRAPGVAPLEKGDVIVSYAGRKIDNVQQLINLKRAEDFGRPDRPLEVQRNGEPLTLAVPSGPLNRASSWRAFRQLGPAVAPRPFGTQMLVSVSLQGATLETHAVADEE